MYVDVDIEYRSGSRTIVYRHIIINIIHLLCDMMMATASSLLSKKFQVFTKKWI